MNEIIMLQGHVIDPSELLSAKLETEHLLLRFRNGETIQLRCGDPVEERQYTHLLGLNQLPSPLPPFQLDCNALDWRRTLKSNLQEGAEVDLINFDYALDREICEYFAISHQMRFQLDPSKRSGSFRKIPPPQ